jgi:hypothetical protein
MLNYFSTLTETQSHRNSIHCYFFLQILEVHRKFMDTVHENKCKKQQQHFSRSMPSWLVIIIIIIKLISDFIITINNLNE